MISNKKLEKILKISFSSLFLVLFICSILFTGKWGVINFIYITIIAYFLINLFKELRNKTEVISLISVFISQAIVLSLITFWNDPRAINGYISSFSYALFIPCATWYFWNKNNDLIKRIALIIINSGLLLLLSVYGLRNSLFRYFTIFDKIFRHSLPLFALLFFILSVLILWFYNSKKTKNIINLRIIGLFISLPLTFCFSIIYHHLALDYPIGARVSEVEYTQFIFYMKLDKNGEVSGSYRVEMNFDWKDEGDLLYDDAGDLLPWQEQPEIYNEIRKEGYIHWTVENSWIESTLEDHYNFNFIFTSNSIYVEETKIGLLRFVKTIDIDGNERNIHYGRDKAITIEYILDVPSGVNVIHNLEGQFVDSVDEKGLQIKRLNAENVTSFEKDKIILSYIHPFFQNRILNWLFKISISEILFWIVTFIFAIITIYLGVINEILKKEKLEPMARKLLIRFKIIEISDSDEKDIKGDI